MGGPQEPDAAFGKELTITDRERLTEYSWLRTATWDDLMALDPVEQP